MSKALLLSLKPRFADAIFSGDKKFEIRKVRPRLESGDLVLVWVTAPRSQLQGAFRVASLLELPPASLWKKVRGACDLTKQEFMEYFDGKSTGFAIEIAEAWPLENTRNLSELRSEQIIPPQSYRYLTEDKTLALLGD